MAVPSLSGIQRRHERQGVELGEAEVADEVPAVESEIQYPLRTGSHTV